MELAQGLGLQARGIGFPGHFMLKVTLPKGQVVIDPFTGKSLSREELGERLEPYKRSNGLVGDFDVPLGLYLQPANSREIIARMLRNLKEVHRAQEDWQRVIAVQDRLIALLPAPGASTATAASRMRSRATTRWRCATWKPT
jgi:regulator of sirC expression with transglutaminase-like and TPR domain